MAAEFAAGPDEVSFVGTPDGLEARLVPEAGLHFHALDARGFDRAKPWTLLTSSLRIALSTVKAMRLIAAEKPDVVVGFGGYVSIPVGFAAALQRVPLVLHEQNSVPGLANKVLSRWAERVAVTYEESAAFMAHPDRVVLTGNPVRPAVLDSAREAGRRMLGLDDDALVLLVFGGSRGARHINSAVLAMRDALMAVEGLRVVQVAGRAEADGVRRQLEAAGGDENGRWQVLDYLDDMGGALAASDLVIARAGATSIAEMTVLGVAAVLVPYPYATDDHQTRNAATAVAHGAAVLVADADLDSPDFSAGVIALLADPARRASMSSAARALGRPDAAARVARIARDAADSHAATSHDIDAEDSVD